MQYSLTCAGLGFGPWMDVVSSDLEQSRLPQGKCCGNLNSWPGRML